MASSHFRPFYQLQPCQSKVMICNACMILVIHNLCMHFESKKKNETDKIIIANKDYPPFPPVSRFNYSTVLFTNVVVSYVYLFLNT